MRYFLENISSPYFFAIVLFFIALWAPFSDTVRRRVLGLGLLILMLLSTWPVPRLLTACLEKQYPIVQSVHPDIQYVVVLSGGQAHQPALLPSMRLYSASLLRLLEGVRLWRQLPNAMLVVSGGAFNEGEESEADNLSDSLAIMAVPPSSILRETRSLNTSEQAKYLRSLLGNNPFYLVTSAMHMPRSMAVMRAQGLHPIAAPTDFTRYWSDERWTKKWIPNPQNATIVAMAMHEYLGRLYYQLRGVL